MKLKIEFNDDGIVYDVMDSVFVGLLNRALISATQESDFSHPDDIRMQAQVAEACKVLIAYYSDPNE
jgi:hypothetical protein